MEIAWPKGVDVETEAAVELRNDFTIAIATTDVRDCFHPFRMPLSLSRLLLSRSNSCTCVLNDWRNARGTEAGGAYRRLAISVSTPHGILLVAVSGPKLQ